VLLDDLVLGLRSTDADLLGVARALLGEHVVDGYDVSPNVSLWVADNDATAQTRELHRLYRRGQTIARTKSLRSLVLGGIRILESFGPVSDEYLALNGRVLVKDDTAVLVSDPFGVALECMHEGRLRRQGWTLTDEVRPRLDRRTLEVVIPEASLHLAADGLARLDALEPARGNDDPVPSGRYRLLGILAVSFWIVEGVDDWSTATRVVNLDSLARGTGGRVELDDLEVLARAVGQVPLRYVANTDPKSVLGALRTLEH
jgi:hypothetical protein